jgi:hypothetical protein
MEWYELYNGKEMIYSGELSGEAFMKYTIFKLLFPNATIYKVTDCKDPVIGNRYLYSDEDGGWEMVA